MEISPKDLRDIEIHSEMRGYNRDEVNELLERAAATIEAANQRVAQLQDRLNSTQAEASRTRETEDILHRTLLLAQRAADEAVAEATAKSRQMLDDAEIQSRRLVADSEAEARRKGESERRRLEEEILDLAGRRDALLADVEAMTRFEAEYRERMVRALEADLFALRSRPTSAPGTRPEPAEVELPAVDATAPEPATAEPAGESLRITDAQMQAQQQVPAPPAEPQPEPQSAADAFDASTREVDVRTLFEQVQARADEAEAAAPSANTSTNATSTTGSENGGLQPIDLLGTDGADADVLDDDAFFATLRDAVHDEKPLGPREDDEVTGDHRFFDQDADRGSFRDVFRRRR